MFSTPEGYHGCTADTGDIMSQKSITSIPGNIMSTLVGDTMINVGNVTDKTIQFV